MDHREGVFVQIQPEDLRGSLEWQQRRRKPGPQVVEQAQGQALACRCEFPFNQRKSTPETPLHPPPATGMALTIEVHVFVLRVKLSSPRPLLRIQLCHDGVKEGDGLRHIRAELRVLLGRCFLLEMKGREEKAELPEPALGRPHASDMERTTCY